MLTFYFCFYLQDVKALQPRVVEEVNDKYENCYYLFEVNTAAVCAAPKLSDTPTGLSTGSILLIV